MGQYFVYLAIEEGTTFGSNSPAWRAPGTVEIIDVAVAESNFRLLPETFNLGTGARQRFDLRIDAGSRAVDAVVAVLRIPEESFTVVDQDTTIGGVQPFAIGEEFAAAKVLANASSGAVGGFVELIFEYLDSAEISGLDGTRSLATLELESSSTATATTAIELQVDPNASKFSHLEIRGNVTEAKTINGESNVLSSGSLVDGGRISGRLILEGRSDMVEEVDFSVRSFGSYAAIEDSAFAASNDIDLVREGIQVALSSAGSFQLEKVPAGRVDLYAHLDGYLQAWAPGLDVSEVAGLVDVIPTSTGAAGDSLMLGGDVAGYTEADGSTQPDNEITLADWDYVSSLFARELTADDDSVRADINGDGQVALADLSMVGGNFRGIGPRPVYKSTVETAETIPGAVASHPVILYPTLVPEAISAGDRVALAVTAEGAGGIYGIDLELVFDVAEWSCLGANAPNTRSPVLTTHKTGIGSWRSAVSQIGRERDFSGPEPLLVWDLQALKDDARQPTLRSIALLDGRHRQIDATVRMPAIVNRPSVHALRQNFPNPFNPTTTISFAVAGDGGVVRLEIFDVLGQVVDVVWNGELRGGEYEMTWDGRDKKGRAVASGVYVYRLKIGPDRMVRRMLLVR